MAQPQKPSRKREPITLSAPAYVEMTPAQHDEAVRAVAALLRFARERASASGEGAEASADAADDAS